MRMMKTVLMCGGEASGGAWQASKVATPASSGANPKIAKTRFENFMTSSLELPAFVLHFHRRPAVCCTRVLRPGSFGRFTAIGAAGRPAREAVGGAGP